MKQWNNWLKKKIAYKLFFEIFCAKILDELLLIQSVGIYLSIDGFYRWFCVHQLNKKNIPPPHDLQTPAIN